MNALRWLGDRFYDPGVMTKFHTASLFVWSAFVPISLATDLKDSTPWVVFLSVWALSTGSWAALQAAHGEREQDRMLTELCQRIDTNTALLEKITNGLDRGLDHLDSGESLETK